MSLEILCRVIDAIITDPYLLEHKGRLVDRLDTPAAVRYQLDTQFKCGTVTVYEYFREIIHGWVSRKGKVATVGSLQDILKDWGFVLAADLLSEFEDGPIIPTESFQKFGISASSFPFLFLFNVTKPTADFVGRAEELHSLQQFFNETNTSAFLVSGSTGEGKSELCRKFIQNMVSIRRAQPLAVTWLRGGSLQELKDSVSRLNTRLGLNVDDTSAGIMELISAAGKRIKADGRDWLVVVDNVDNEFPELAKVVEKLREMRAKVVVTATNANDSGSSLGLEIPSEYSIQLGSLSEVEAHELLRKTLRTTNVDVPELCAALGNQALALRQAVAVINAKEGKGEYGFSVKEYLDEQAKPEVKKLPLAQTEENTLNDVRKVEESKSLGTSDGVCDNANSKLQRTLGTTDVDVPELCAALGNQALALREAVAVINAKEGKGEDNIISTQTEENTPNDVRQHEKCKSSDISDEESDNVDCKPPTIEDLKMQALKFYNKHDLAKALEFHREVYDLELEHLGDSNSSTMMTLHNIGCCLLELGKFEEAKQVFTRVIGLRLTELGEKDLNTLMTKSLLAETLYSLGQKDRAIAMKNEVYVARRQVLGEGHPDTAMAREKIAFWKKLRTE